MLVACITREAWFSEVGYPSLPDSGDTFIIPSLVPCDDGRNPPNTKQERIIYFKFVSGFIPTSLLNQFIADCISSYNPPLNTTHSLTLHSPQQSTIPLHIKTDTIGSRLGILHQPM